MQSNTSKFRYSSVRFTGDTRDLKIYDVNFNDASFETKEFMQNKDNE